MGDSTALEKLDRWAQEPVSSRRFERLRDNFSDHWRGVYDDALECRARLWPGRNRSRSRESRSDSTVPGLLAAALSIRAPARLQPGGFTGSDPGFFCLPD